jgi:rubrerythrin
MAEDICKMLNEAIEDEKKAAAFYSELAKLIGYGKGTEYVLGHEVVRHIKDQEEKHGLMLLAIKKMICEKKPFWEVVYG